MMNSEDFVEDMSIDAQKELAFSNLTRAQNIERMQTELFDVVVIGGGITGAGIARDAALRDFSVCLVEKGDFASGTSSKSARMVHGGLRYLAQYQVAMVMSACAERHHLRRIAPNLVRPARLILPVFKDARIGLLRMRLGIWFYELLALFRNIERHRVVSAAAAAKGEPVLSANTLDGAVYYYDCLADDARLTLATIKAAHSEGAAVANYVTVTGLLKDNNRVVGIEAKDEMTGQEMQVRSWVVVNATAVWGDRIRRMDDPEAVSLIEMNRGSHVVVSREKLPINDVIIFSSKKGRSMYAVPWDKTVIVGTTDIDHAGDLENVFASSEEVENILEAIRSTFSWVDLTQDDILSTFAGLRSLVDIENGDAYHASRDHKIVESESGLISIFGGKLTTHRKMAEDVMKRAAKKLASEHQIKAASRRSTKRAPLTTTSDEQEFSARLLRVQYSWAETEVLEHLVRTYCEDAAGILEAADAEPNLASRIVPELPYIWAELPFAVEHEMAMTLRDFLIRRTHIIHEAEDQGLGIAKEAAERMGQYLKWDIDTVQSEVSAYREQVELTQSYTKG